MVEEYGLLDSGFNRKRLPEILSDENDKTRAIFGNSINLDPTSPDGQVNGNSAIVYAELWELLEKLYGIYNPSTAQGTALSNLVQLNGLTRLGEAKSTVTLSLTGDPLAVVSSGSIVTNGTSRFIIDSDVTLDGSGDGVAEATAEEFGEVVGLSGTITIIETPLAGWDTVTNPLDAILGRLVETDVQLRVRRNSSFSLAGQSVIEAINAQISAIEGVSEVSILENISNTIDSNNVPPHGFTAVVEGGDNQEIAKAIWLKKSAGSAMGGDVTEDIIDSQGNIQPIKFARPDAVPIYIEVTLSKSELYPADGDDLIKALIVEYANGNLVEGEGFFLGSDVIQSRLYTPVNKVTGHDILSIFISKSPNPTLSANIPITSIESSFFEIANINIV